MIYTHLNKETFTQEFTLDMQSEAYIQIKEKLKNVQGATNLYTYIQQK